MRAKQTNNNNIYLPNIAYKATRNALLLCRKHAYYNWNVWRCHTKANIIPRCTNTR